MSDFSGLPLYPDKDVAAHSHDDQKHRGMDTCQRQALQKGALRAEKDDDQRERRERIYQLEQAGGMLVRHGGRHDICRNPAP